LFYIFFYSIDHVFLPFFPHLLLFFLLSYSFAFCFLFFISSL
jgi:hypothetical protein